MTSQPIPDSELAIERQRSSQSYRHPLSVFLFNGYNEERVEVVKTVRSNIQYKPRVLTMNIAGRTPDDGVVMGNPKQEGLAE